MIVIRRIARIIGSFSAFFFLVTIIGQNIVRQQHVPLSMSTLTTATSLGIIVAWRNERLGAYVTMFSAVALGVVLYPISTTDPMLASLFYSLPFLIPGILFWLCSRSDDTPNNFFK